MSRTSKAFQEIQKKPSWEMMTDKDIDEIYKTKCRKCKYRGTFGSRKCCDYILHTGHSRGCRPDKCTRFEKGPRQKMTVNPGIDGRPGQVGAYKKSTYVKRSGTYFGKIIEDYLYKNGLQQRDLGDKVGVKSFTIADWRHLKKKPSDENLEALCAVIGISVETAKEAMKKGLIE